MENKPIKTVKGKVVAAFAWICVVLGVIAAGYGLYVTAHDANKFALGNLSSFGSYAQGTVASLWSLGALFFLYATLLAQRQQIAQQERQLEQQQFQFRQDMEKRKFENNRQEEQFKSQQRAIQLQNFESSFFQLLQIFNQIVADLKDYEEVRITMKETKEVTYERRECFTHWHSMLHNNFRDGILEEIANVNLPTNRTDERIIKLYYERFYKLKQASLGHYFRILYHIVKLVHTSNVHTTYEEKRRYVSLIRAQLSAFELVLIFYNGISTNAIKFKPLMETYGLFEHLDKKLLLDDSHSEFYKPSAYK
jgi:hypothetical protein